MNTAGKTTFRNIVYIIKSTKLGITVPNRFITFDGAKEFLSKTKGIKDWDTYNIYKVETTVTEKFVKSNKEKKNDEITI